MIEDDEKLFEEDSDTNNSEPEVKEEKKPKKVSKKEERVIVTVVRANIFEEPVFTSRSLTGAVMGNQLILLSDSEVIHPFLRVRFPKKDGQHVEGFILSTKVKRI